MEKYQSYINQTTCEGMFDKNFQQFIGPDKFCTDSANGNSIIRKQKILIKNICFIFRF